jgi:hypothetical protein
MNNPHDQFEKIMRIMFWIVVSYFVVVFIPQVLIKLSQ